MGIKPKDLEELLSAGILPQETVETIIAYYRGKHPDTPNRQFIIFAILGGLLIGLGIILILAHNWDELPKNVKLVLAFFPLLAGQALCAYTLLRKNTNTAWRESSSAFITCGVGAAIALVAQIYNIPGDMGSFMLTWTVLVLPIIYLLQSSVASLLYLIGITFYAMAVGYDYPKEIPFPYIFLVAAILPFYFGLLKNKGDSNFTAFHHWAIVASISIALGAFSGTQEELLFVSYTALFGIFYFIGHLDFFRKKSIAANAWLSIGSLGTVCVLMPLSFNWFWNDLFRQTETFAEITSSAEFGSAVFMTVVALVLLVHHRLNKASNDLAPIEPVFLIFSATYFLGYFSYASPIIVNLIIFCIGLFTIKRGIRQDHLGIVNYGLLIITILVICRFFDTDLSFVIRGLLFISVGAGFIITNTKLLKRRREYDSK